MSSRKRAQGTLPSESARRQLMQPVVCWERAWVVPDVLKSNAASGSSKLKVLRWIKTEKVQLFDDHVEGELDVDEPLAPLPEDVVDVDEDEEDNDNDNDNDPAVNADAAPTAPAAGDNDAEQPEDSEQLNSHVQLSVPTVVDDAGDEGVDDNLDDVLKPRGDVLLPPGEDVKMGEGGADELMEGEGIQLDISGLGPDGLQVEGSHDLSQLGEDDALMGASGLMEDENSSSDPFANIPGLEVHN
ncbi:hypothetical protein FISHEDRAFT_71159 [Fistulina hepatica ATCC 64428]|nr:hypothetical protein FISHEDRAFT_71159 [Fistulina hepatica ATCC 64428]